MRPKLSKHASASATSQPKNRETGWLGIQERGPIEFVGKAYQKSLLSIRIELVTETFGRR